MFLCNVLNDLLSFFFPVNSQNVIYVVDCAYFFLLTMYLIHIYSFLHIFCQIQNFLIIVFITNRDFCYMLFVRFYAIPLLDICCLRVSHILRIFFIRISNTAANY